jgi:hypothetical protein
MTKLYIRLDDSATELDAVQAIVNGDTPFAGATIDEMVQQVEEDGGEYAADGTVFVFEIVDKGKIETSHKFVSSKKTKETKPA